MAKKYIIFILFGAILICISCSKSKTSQETNQKNISHSSYKEKIDDFVDVVNDDLYTPDLAFFGLKGNVRGFKEIHVEADYNGKKFVPKEKHLVFGKEYNETFDTKGRWICPKDRFVTRDSKGQMISIDTNDPEAIPIYNSITWKNGKVVSILSDFDTHYQYTYNKDGLRVSQIIYAEGDFPYRDEYKYSYSTFDEHGNWTKRCEKVISSPEDCYWITYRKIFYYTTHK